MSEQGETGHLPTKYCIACGSEIPAIARVCKECNHHQGWRRYLPFTSTILSMIVALVSVLVVGLPPLIEILIRPEAEILMTFHRLISKERVSLVAHNAGSVAGIVDSNATLKIDLKQGGFGRGSRAVFLGSAPTRSDTDEIAKEFAEWIDRSSGESVVYELNQVRGASREFNINLSIEGKSDAEIQENALRWIQTNADRVTELQLGIPLYADAPQTENPMLSPGESREIAFIVPGFDRAFETEIKIGFTLPTDDRGSECRVIRIIAKYTATMTTTALDRSSDLVCNIELDSLDAYGNRDRNEIPVNCGQLWPFVPTAGKKWELQNLEFNGQPIRKWDMTKDLLAQQPKTSRACSEIIVEDLF